MKHIKKFEVFESKINESVELVAPIVGILGFLFTTGVSLNILKNLWKDTLGSEPASTIEEIEKQAAKLSTEEQDELLNRIRAAATTYIEMDPSERSIGAV